MLPRVSLQPSEHGVRQEGNENGTTLNTLLRAEAAALCPPCPEKKVSRRTCPLKQESGKAAGAGQPVLGEFIQQFVIPAAEELLQPWLHPSEPGCAKLGAAGVGTRSWARGSHWKDLYTLLSLRHSPEGFTARL